MSRTKHRKETSENEETNNYALLILAAIIVVICITLLFGWYIYWTIYPEPTSSTHNQSDVKNVCQTPDCIRLAHQMNNFGNKSVDPCVDFYGYTCGRTLITEYWHKNRNVSTDSKSERIMKQLFELCSSIQNPENKAHHNEALHRDLLADINKVGSWPMIDPSFNGTKFNVSQYLENMAGKLNMIKFGLFKFDFSKLFVIVYDEEAYNWSYSTKQKILQLVKYLIIKSKVQVDPKTFETDMKDVDELQQKLRQLQHDKMVQFRTFDEFLSENRPLINFEKIIKPFIHPKHPQHWEKIQKFIYLNPRDSYYNKSGKLHQLIRATSPRTMANFLILRMVHNAIGFIDYANSLKCSNLVIDLMPQAVLRVYVRNYFDKGNLKLATDVIEKFKEAFVKMFQNSSWLHQESKDKGIIKLKKIRSVVGYPEEFEAPGALDALFEELTDVSPSDSFYVLARKLRGFYAQWNILQYVNGVKFYESINDINGIYNPVFNTFLLFVSLIDDPFFTVSLPEIVRMSMVGNIIGHEIGHAFDTQNSQYDGDFNQVNWLNSEDLSEYGNRQKCLIDQYDNHDDPSFGRNLKGNTTLNENVADMLGIKTAWMAYKDMKGVQPSIIGFEDYSPDKLFFHLRALTWCSSYDTHALSRQLIARHGVKNFRVNGIHSNMKEFAEAFQCPIGSPMNPEKKCTLF
uniref:Endothelin-converting enzyme 1 n=1 Tax=Caenorhabditis japonica TaxID=281687 RepID=A0A8R1HRP9_CAEJA